MQLRSSRVFGLVVALIALSAAALHTSLTDPTPTPTAQTANRSATDARAAGQPDRRRIARALRREQRNGTAEAEVKPSAEAKARCDRPNSATWFSTADARFMYLDPSEDPESTGPTRNRAAGCLYETGVTTEFGFSDMIDGATFGQVTSAGDFTAFVVSEWQATEASVESVEVWNLRAGTRLYRGNCYTSYFDCLIHDIAVSEAGSSAYIGCRDRDCVVVARLAGSRTQKVLAKLPVPRMRKRAILRSEDRLYWLSARGGLRSIAFP